MTNTAEGGMGRLLAGLVVALTVAIVTASPHVDADMRMGLGVNVPVAGDVVWTSAQDLTVHGKAFDDTDSFFDRLPASARGKVRDAVWSLSRDSAGYAVEFVSTCGDLFVNYTLRSSSLSMWHMASTGVSGMDVYAESPSGSGDYRYVATFHGPTGLQNEGPIVTGVAGPFPRRFLIHLPTYNGVESMSVGVPAGHTLSKVDNAFTAGEPIVWYGTSILQGAVSARPGTAYTNQIRRKLRRDVVNLGFSGNGIMELSVAEYMVRLNASVFIIDCLPNMNASQVTANAEPLVSFLRNAHPTTPIILVEGTTYGGAWAIPAIQKAQEEKRAALRAVWEAIKGKYNVQYVKGEDLFGEGTDDNTVDGVHPTDLGAARMIEFWVNYLRNILHL